MKEYRKLLMRKIDHAFAQGKYPFFYGICGMGKHEALHGYAQRQKRACKTLNGEMPDDPSCIYMIDQFDDERYLRRLCEALKTQTACHVCFISEHMLPACMYELMLERIQLFPADDFCFSLSECQRLLRSEHLDEEQIKAIFLHSDGCLAAIRYHLRREQEDLERYWTSYLSHCYQLFSDAQQKLMHQLSTIGSLEREGAQELLQADPEMLRQLVNAGMLREEAGILRVPACLRRPLSEDEALLNSLFEYHLRKGQIVRAWRCARSLSQQEKLFTARGGELALMAKEDELPMLQEASQGYFLMQAIVLFRQHCQLQLHTLLHAHVHGLKRLHGLLVFLVLLDFFLLGSQLVVEILLNAFQESLCGLAGLTVADQATDIHDGHIVLHLGIGQAGTRQQAQGKKRKK